MENKSSNKGFLKYLFVGIIILILIILSFCIKSKIYDRESISDDAKYSIVSSAGNRLCISGVWIQVPWTSSKSVWSNDRFSTEGNKDFFASKITYDAQLKSENRYLGIYSAPIFTGSVNLKSIIKLPDFNSNKTENPEMKFDLKKAVVCLNIKDISLAERPVLIINGKSYEVSYNANAKYFCCEIDITDQSTLEINGELKVRGADEFRVYLNSEDTELNINADWKSPGFSGYDYLPSERNISENGFTATWKVPFDRGDGSHTIGFAYIQPVDLYSKLLRSVSYGFLFIIVPFIVLFLFEVFAKINLHPMNYLLCGAASVIFFLLLLSISEHLSFGLSYLIGAFAAGLLVSLYVCWITGKIKLGVIMSFVFVLLYTYLYVCLLSEDYALLMGSIFAFILLAVIMFITRKIDWTNLKKSNDTDLI